jgi:hypothetical protein
MKSSLHSLIPFLPFLNHLRLSTLSRNSEPESDLLYDWRFTANQFVLATSPLRLTTRNFIFQLNTCSYNPYVTSSLMRGRVCRLQLLLGLASTVILRSESRGTHDQILLSHIQDSPNLVGHVPVFISPRNWVALFYPQALVGQMWRHVALWKFTDFSEGYKASIFRSKE